MDMERESGLVIIMDVLYQKIFAKTKEEAMLSPQNSNYSRFASESEIKSSLYKVNFNGDVPQYGGIPLFTETGAVYIEPTDTHSLIIGSTGSKKTRLIGMPALRLYALAGESFISTDPKAELYERTLPHLKEQGYRVFVLNLRDPVHSNLWNPFIVPYHLYHNGQRDKAIELINDMAGTIVKEVLTTDYYWQNSAADMLAGLILVMFECAQESEINFKSLRGLRTQAFKITSERLDSENHSIFIKEKFLNNLDASGFINSLLGGTAEVCDSTRGCIVSVFDQAMRPFFGQDNLIDMLSANELEMSKIGKEKTAVFLIIPDENTLYHRLISVFVKQCYTELIIEAQKHPSLSLPRRVNFLLDEFSSLPPISDFPAMVTASRSRNIRFNLFVQSIQQLRDRYGGHAETIKGNCENWVFFHSREYSLLEELTNLSGMRNQEDTLVSMARLQTLDKDKGEAFIMHKRMHPYIACLPDIDSYPGIASNCESAEYPKNSCKADAVFNFERFCRDNSNFFLSKLFSGKTHDEIRNISSEEQERYYMTDDDDDEIIEPIFTSIVPDDE
jgi:type IV secretion system protein VirD4